MKHGMSRADWVALAAVYEESAKRYDAMAAGFMAMSKDAQTVADAHRFADYAANERRKAENLRANAA